MHRYHLILLILAWAVTSAAAGDGMNYPQVDSLTGSFCRNGQWDALESWGDAAIASGLDYPQLRMRMGYADFLNDRHRRSLVHCRRALDQDAGNGLARLYQYWNNLYLNRPEAAAAAAGKLPLDLREQNRLRSFRPLTRLDAELSLARPQIQDLDNGYYGRVGLNSQLHWNVSLYQSFSIYRQTVWLPPPLSVIRPRRPFDPVLTANSLESQYYALLSVMPRSDLQLKAAGSYILSRTADSDESSRIAFAGVKYLRPYWDLQAEGSVCSLSDSLFRQYGLQLTVYLLEDLDLYLSGRLTVQQWPGGWRNNYTQTVGGKISERMWLEGSATLKPMINFLEHDALYLSSAADYSRYQGTAAVCYMTGANTILRLSYSLEGKRRPSPEVYYQQHSINGGVSWTF